MFIKDCLRNSVFFGTKEKPSSPPPHREDNSSPPPRSPARWLFYFHREERLALTNGPPGFGHAVFYWGGGVNMDKWNKNNPRWKVNVATYTDQDKSWLS